MARFFALVSCLFFACLCVPSVTALDSISISDLLPLLKNADRAFCVSRTLEDPAHTMYCVDLCAHSVIVAFAQTTAGFLSDRACLSTNFTIPAGTFKHQVGPYGYFDFNIYISTEDDRHKLGPVDPHPETDLDCTRMSHIFGDQCEEVCVDALLVSLADQFIPGLDPGSCARDGYTVFADSTTHEMGPLGSFTVKTYVKPAGQETHGLIPELEMALEKLLALVDKDKCVTVSALGANMCVQMCVAQAIAPYMQKYAHANSTSCVERGYSEMRLQLQRRVPPLGNFEVVLYGKAEEDSNSFLDSVGSYVRCLFSDCSSGAASAGTSDDAMSL